MNFNTSNMIYNRQHSAPRGGVRRNAKICFEFVNKGVCKYDTKCLYRHVDQNEIAPVTSSTIPTCTQFASRGTCSFGKACRFSHASPVVQPLVDTRSGSLVSVYHEEKSKQKICFEFTNKSVCRYGDHCTYKHVQRICFDFVNKKSCKWGENCKYLHTQENQFKLCLDWVNKGKCSRGDKCQFKHADTNKDRRSAGKGEPAMGVEVEKRSQSVSLSRGATPEPCAYPRSCRSASCNTTPRIMPTNYFAFPGQQMVQSTVSEPMYIPQSTRSVAITPQMAFNPDDLSAAHSAPLPQNTTLLARPTLVNTHSSPMMTQPTLGHANSAPLYPVQCQYVMSSAPCSRQVTPSPPMYYSAPCSREGTPSPLMYTTTPILNGMGGRADMMSWHPTDQMTLVPQMPQMSLPAATQIPATVLPQSIDATKRDPPKILKPIKGRASMSHMRPTNCRESFIPCDEDVVVVPPFGCDDDDDEEVGIPPNGCVEDEPVVAPFVDDDEEEVAPVEKDGTQEKRDPDVTPMLVADQSVSGSPVLMSLVSSGSLVSSTSMSGSLVSSTSLGSATNPVYANYSSNPPLISGQQQENQYYPEVSLQMMDQSYTTTDANGYPIYMAIDPATGAYQAYRYSATPMQGVSYYMDAQQQMQPVGYSY